MFHAERDPRISFTVDGKMEITLTCDKSVIDSIEALKGKELQVEIKPYSKKRTMTQNSYLWALIGELARKLGITKDECYREFVKDYGIYEIVPIKNEAKERFSALSPLNLYFSTIDLGFTIHKEPEGEPDWGHYDSVCELELGRVFGRMAAEVMKDGE